MPRIGVEALSNYKLAEGLVIQRPYLQGPDRPANIIEYARNQMDDDGFDPDAVVVAVSHSDEDSVLTMNMVAGFVFETLIAGMSDGWVVDNLLELFDAEREEVEQDVSDIIGEMLEHGLIVEA